MIYTRRQTIINLIVFLFCAIVLVAIVAVGFAQVRNMQTQTRGITYGARTETAFGVNASLEQYSDADLPRALALIRDGGFKIVRQHFYWNDIEPRRGEFAWDKSDCIVARASENNLQIVAVIDTTPVWARHPGEADLLNAPPANVDDYARFVAAFVKRYGDRVPYIQVWDNPNVHPFWGRRNTDPFEYAELLRGAAINAREANPNVKIISAGLAANGELIRGHPDYSDVLFLRGLYQAGARDYFDIVGAKAYGMWTGPADRRVDQDVFNFSRAILLRDEMLAYGDVNKPIWAVEFGWNALPQDWRGAPSSWGSDTEATQSKRLTDAVARVRSEWSWMPVLIAQTFQPNAPGDNPLWGFAFVDQDFKPRAFYSAFSQAIAAPVQPASFDFTRFYLTLAALTFVAFVALWRGAMAAWQLPWERIWIPIESRFAALPEFAQFATLALAVAAFYFSPNVVLNFVFLALIVFLFAWRLDLGLAITVFTIPFYLLPKNLFGGTQFSLVEVLTLGSVTAFAIRQLTAWKQHAPRVILSEAKNLAHNSNSRDSSAQKPRLRMTNMRSVVGSLRSMDWAVIGFVALGILSVATASNFGVAIREFRVIVIEPALLYGLIRASNLSSRDLYRLIHAFILSAVAISLVGLYQFAFTNWVIVGEGVRRVLAVYGSPNNLALYLDRALPLAIALFVVRDLSRNKLRTTNILLYVFSAIIIALALYLTYSRGAWLGIVAGLACVGFFSDRRIRLAMFALLVISAVFAIPFLQTERAQSLFQIGTGTGFFRVSVWQSAIAMIRDHPVFGVGLDNFLYEYPRYINPEAWREPNLSHPHNIVLDFWVRLGIGGVMALVWMLIEFYRAGLQKIETHRALVIGLLASMTAALAHGMIDASYFYVDLAFVWMLVLGVMASFTSQAPSHTHAV